MVARVVLVVDGHWINWCLFALPILSADAVHQPVSAPNDQVLVASCVAGVTINFSELSLSVDVAPRQDMHAFALTRSVVFAVTSSGGHLAVRVTVDGNEDQACPDLAAMAALWEVAAGKRATSVGGGGQVHGGGNRAGVDGDAPSAQKRARST